MAPEQVLKARQASILDAMVSLVYEVGFAGASVTSVCARAKVSRRTFYEAFESREDCFLTVLDTGYRRASVVMSHEFEHAEYWRDGVQAALAELLLLFDAEPRLARVWLVESLAAGSWALERREHHVAALTRLIVGYWRPPAGAGSHPLAAVGVMTAVVGIVQGHLIAARPEPLITLLGPLMGLVAAPYLDEAAVIEEIERGGVLAQRLLESLPRERPPNADKARPLPAVLRNPKAQRARQCLLHLAEHPGASNRQVAIAIGIHSHTQISTLLARLAQLRLLVKDAGRPGHPNAWSLTSYGLQAAQALVGERHADASG